MIRELAIAAAALAGYVAVVVWETWPLAAHAATHLNRVTAVSPRDVPYITWVLAWQSHALATAPSTILDANIYWPTRRALLYGDPGLGALPYFAPVFLATGNPTLAVNCLFLGGIALTAWSLHLVVRRWCGSHAAGMVAAATLLMNPWTLDFFSWAPSYAVLFYLPWIAYVAATRTLRLRDALWLAPLVVLQCLANLVYISPATLAPLGLLALARLVSPRTRRQGVALAMALVLAAVGLAPIYAGYIGTRRANADVQERNLLRAELSPEAESVVVVVGKLPRTIVHVPEDVAVSPRSTWAALTTIVVVAVGALCAMRAATEWRGAWTHGLLWTAMGFVLSIPAVSFFGGPGLASPFYWLLGRELPAADQVIRAPIRLGLISVVGWAILAGVAFAACSARVGRRAVPLLLVVVLAGLYAQFRPYVRAAFPLFPAIDGQSAVTRALRDRRGPVLELPLAGNGGVRAGPHASAMYRSIFHWRPLLNGYSSYWPDGFRARMALALRLPDAEALATLRRETGLANVVVGLRALTPDARAQWERLAAGARDDLRLVVRDRDELLFEVESPE